jgi:hypothetical protein
MHRFDKLKSKLKNAMPKRDKGGDTVTMSVSSVSNNVRETGVNEEEAAETDDDDEEEDEYGKESLDNNNNNNLNKPIEFVITPPCDNQSTPFITYIDDSNEELDAISPLVDEKNFKQLNVTTTKFDTASAVDEFYTNQLINSVEFLYTKRSKKQPKSMYI